MTKPTAKKWPALKKAWDEYGHLIAWDDLVDLRQRGGHEGAYVLVAWVTSPGFYSYASLAWNGEAWEMQDDSADDISVEDWKNIKFTDNCDWHNRPDDKRLSV